MFSGAGSVWEPMDYPSLRQHVSDRCRFVYVSIDTMSVIEHISALRM